MFLKHKIKTERTKSKKKTALIVSSAHVLVLILLFSFFYLKGCTTNKHPNSVKVTIVSPSQAQPAEKKTVKKNTKKKTNKVPKKVPSKKKSRLLSPDQIIKSTDTIVSKPQKVVHKVNTSEITQNIRDNISKMNFNNIDKQDQSLIDYYDQVSQYLYSIWKQPPRAFANNGVQIVKIVISVDSNGNINNSNIVDKCGISAIDSSVENLLSALTSLPKPPHGSEKLEIDMVTTPYDF